MTGRKPPQPRVDPTPLAARKGARVRVLAGPFAGSIGTVSGADVRGGVRVLLGTLTVRIEASDLEPVVRSRARPTLPSSHRGPRAPERGKGAPDKPARRRAP